MTPWPLPKPKSMGPMAERNAEMLRDAIKLGEAAAEYCAEQQKLRPHYAAASGKLRSVHLSNWRRALAAMAR